MADTDLQIIEDANAAALTIDRVYRRASLVEKVKLKPSRDKAFNAYAKARLKLLEDGTLSTAADLNEMKHIRQEIARARQTQTVIAGAVKLAQFLVKFA